MIRNTGTNVQWNIQLSVISILVLAALMFGMFGTIQPALADDCLLEHLAVIAARAALDLAKANSDAAADAVANAEGFGETLAALAWKAAAEIALNLAESNHDTALQNLEDCLNPLCACNCGYRVNSCPCPPGDASSGGNDSGGNDSSTCSE